MTPILFPFTHLSKDQAALVLECFETVFLLRVSSQAELEKEMTWWKDSVHLIAPDDETVEQVRQSVSSYRNWAQIHKSTKGSLRALLKDTPYFTSDSSVSTLISSIGKEAAQARDKTSASMDQRDPWMDALMFLRLAQEADYEQEQIDTAFQRVTSMENGLFSQIKGQDAAMQEFGRPGKKSYQTDPGLVMTEKRVLSWFRFFSKLPQTRILDDPIVFVTTSPAVVEVLESVSEKIIKLLDIDKFTVHERGCENKKGLQELLSEAIKEAMASRNPVRIDLDKMNDDCPGRTSVQLFLFSGKNDVFKEILSLMVEKEKGKQIQETELMVPVFLIS